MRQSPSLLLFAFGSPAAAWLKNPFSSSQSDESWTPPRETSPAEHDAQFAQGWTPRPTDAPKPRFGRMNLLPRDDDYVLAPGTCGFISSNEYPYVCIESRATCTLTGDYVGCCVPNSNCNVVKTTCIDYEEVQSGACNLPDDFSTLCCASSARGSCYTYLFSTTSGTDSDLTTFSFLDCSARGGTGTLLTYDPTWSRTRVPASETDSSTDSTTDNSDTATETASGTDTGTDTATGTQTDSSSTATESQTGGGGGGGSSTNVGAIAGGAVGGVAALGLIGAGVFLWLRRKKKSKDASTGSSPSQAPSQPNPQFPSSPPMTQTPASGAAYPSGVPSPSTYNAAYSPQQQYDPHMSTYSQGSYPPPQQGYQPFPPQGQYPQQQYPPQQGLHPQYGYQPSSTGSPPPHTTPSPPVGGAPVGGFSPQPQPPASELQSINPVGSQSNRAELS